MKHHFTTLKVYIGSSEKKLICQTGDHMACLTLFATEHFIPGRLPFGSAYHISQSLSLKVQ